MRHISLRHLLAGIAMLIAASLAVAMTPRQKLADLRPRMDPNTLVPKQFGNWRVDKAVVPVAPSADIQATLEKTYTQTLSRTYVNRSGQTVMLSIAYARVSYDGLETHVPEVCYPSQGFQLHNLHDSHLHTHFGDIPVKRLVATRWSRVEPITYWVIVGDQIVVGGWPWRLTQIRYGLRGVIPDNMLVRVSNISTDTPLAYSVQRDFVDALLGALNGQARSRFIGVIKSS